VYESFLTASTNFFPFENIALEIKDQCKIIDMHNGALNQNLEGLTNLFVGRSSVSKLLFHPVDMTRWLRSAFANKNCPFLFIFPFVNYSMVVSQSG
jgi:hypothetical protein